MAPNKFCLKWILFPFVVFLSFLTRAQDNPRIALTKFQKIDLKDGLSNLNISSIVQDDLGYIWIATARGLNRFDGISFKYYLYGQANNALFNARVTKLYKNQEGLIFCSTGYGLNLLNPERDEISQISSNKEFFFDFIDFGQHTYATSDLGGISIFNNKTRRFKKIPHISNNGLLNNLTIDPGTGIWAITYNRTIVASLKAESVKLKQVPTLVNYNPSTNKFREFKIPVDTNIPYSGHMIRIDSVLCIIGQSIRFFNLRTLKFIPFPKKWDNLNKVKGLDIAFIKQIEEDHLWIGTKAKGLYIHNLKNNTLISQNKINSQFDAYWPTCIYMDKDNNIWLGTFERGLKVSFKERGNFNFNKTLNNLIADKFITCITSDSAQNLFIGTRYYGFYIYNNKTKRSTIFNQENSFLSSNNIQTLFMDSQNKLWVASKKELHIVNPDEKESINFSLPEPNRGINSFCETEGKIIASSHSHGLFIFDSNGTLLKQEKRLGSKVSQVLKLNKNEILVSVYDNGIYTYNIETGAFNNIYKASISENYNLNQPTTMYLDTDSVLWIGNYMAGLHKLNLKTNAADVFTIEDGLPNNDIVGIVEDKSGELWLSTSYGLSHFNKKGEFSNYFYNEGLDNIQFHRKAAHVDQSGTVLFGGNMGLTYFDPEKLTQLEIKKAPKIILKALRIKNKEVKPGDETNILSKSCNNTQQIVLSHKNNGLTFEYHAFDFIAADEIRYAYILDGLEEEWNNVGKRNFANYANLHPGNYTFKVKAKNNKGIWSDASSIKIKILSSPFLSTVAFVIYFLLLSLITYIAFRLIIRAKLYKSKLEIEQNERIRENEIAEMKMRFFTNISHEIRTPLTLIKGNADLLSKHLIEKKINVRFLNGLNYSTNRLMGLVNQLLSVRKLENDALDLKVKKDDIVQITHKLIQPFVYVASSRSITINVETVLDKLILPIDEDKYEKIMSNLLSNSLKHVTEKGAIKVKIEILESQEIVKYFENKSNLIDDSFVKISVIDNGIGIPTKDLSIIFNRFSRSEMDKRKPDYSGTGIGLNFTKRLVKLHHGAITASSKKNIETIISFVLPLNDKIFSKDSWVSNELNLKTEVPEILPDETNKVNESNEKSLILLVEDDLELNRFISSSLKKHFKVISCYNGKEGMRLIQNRLPTLIISDIMMPEMDGFSLCKNIRQDEMISHIPIILLTAKTDEESKISGYKYGADDYISKPFEVSVLIARIANLIDSRKRLQASYKQGILENPNVTITNQFELNFVKKIESIVAAEYHSPKLNVTVLAAQMNMGRTNFYRKFMSVMDISPKDFITKYRINKSIELIYSGIDNFGEISHLCGFGTQSNYSAIFKKEKGLSPLQYRKSVMFVEQSSDFS